MKKFFESFAGFIIENKFSWLLALAFILIAVCLVVFVIFKKKDDGKGDVGSRDSDNSADKTASNGIQVAKLHEQGARKSQQDCFFVSPESFISTQGLLAVVADGMGGLSDGDKVSQAAVTAVMNSFFQMSGESEKILPALLGQANAAVNQLLGPSGYGQSGSTIVMGLIKEGFFYWLSVGDSRICLYRGGVLYQLNREHVYKNELLVKAANGEVAYADVYTHPKAAGLTSFLGMGQLKHIDIPATPLKVYKGDIFMLMSDGVYNAVAMDDIKKAAALGAEESVKYLQKSISEKNFPNQDNYTAVVIECE